MTFINIDSIYLLINAYDKIGAFIYLIRKRGKNPNTKKQQIKLNQMHTGAFWCNF